jgi:hypothetical protein
MGGASQHGGRGGVRGGGEGRLGTAGRAGSAAPSGGSIPADAEAARAGRRIAPHADARQGSTRGDGRREVAARRSARQQAGGRCGERTMVKLVLSEQR